MSFDFKYNYPQIARNSGFKLRQFRDGPLDWRLVASLEVERILREQQFEHIDAILLYLSEAPLASLLESNILDGGIAKYFILSQLAIQYLIFCRKFLDETVRTLRESLVHTEAENINLKKINQDHSNEILQLHKQISQTEVINDVIFPCHVCTKNFISNDALNIHLNKKHSKIQTGEMQYKDNDRTLINTIKLELEIKQLKERLNIAEKDIRETVESKKGSPREVAKTSSTQINAATIDKGTQSNLTESKETDCAEYVNKPKFDMFFQIQKKISNLESWQETQSTGNQQSINEITQKLSEISKSMQSRAEQDAENFNKLVKDAISSSVSSKQHLPITSTDELQAIISNSLKNVLHLNSTKLSDILTKIEAICEEKFPSLEVEIQGDRLIAHQSSQTALSKPLSAIASFSNNEEQSFANPRAYAPQNTERLINKQPIIMELPLPASLSESYSNKGNQPFERKECSTPYSKGTYSIEQISPIGFPKGNPSDDNETDVSQEILYSEEDEIEHVPFEIMKATQNNSALIKKPIKSVEKEMASYGIFSNIKTLSASEIAEITAHLAEKRTSLKKIHPRFCATRNKLKKIVDGLSSTNKQINSPPNNMERLSKVRLKKDFPLNCRKDEYKINDAFKIRLEDILSSPIKKPKEYVTNYKYELGKPIPLPRKRVMFHNAEQASEVLHPTSQSKATI